jgi:hypothetical protein
LILSDKGQACFYSEIDFLPILAHINTVIIPIDQSTVEDHDIQRFGDMEIGDRRDNKIKMIPLFRRIFHIVEVLYAFFVTLTYLIVQVYTIIMHFYYTGN